MEFILNRYLWIKNYVLKHIWENDFESMGAGYYKVITIDKHQLCLCMVFQFFFCLAIWVLSSSLAKFSAPSNTPHTHKTRVWVCSLDSVYCSGTQWSCIFLLLYCKFLVFSFIIKLVHDVDSTWLTCSWPRNNAWYPFSQLCASHSANTVNASGQTSASVILDMPAKPAIKVGKLCDTSKQS